MTLIDQPARERGRREVRAADGQITGGPPFHDTDRIRVEAALEPSRECRRSLQRRGVHDLVRRLPDLREVGLRLRLRGQGGVGLPRDIVFLGGADFDSPPPLGTTGRSRYVKVKTVEEAQAPEMYEWIEQAPRQPGWK